MAPMPDGFHVEYAVAQPDDGLTWSESELRDRYNGDTRIRCGYCLGRTRSRDLVMLVDWFHSHECGDTHDSMTCACIAEAA